MNRSTVQGASVGYTGCRSANQVFVIQTQKEGTKMDPISLVKLEDVNGAPVAKISGLPTPLRVGDPVGLNFQIQRLNGGRTEALQVSGQFRITAVGFDATTVPPRQLLSVESMTIPPKWRSIKKTPERRPLAPTHSPPTMI